MKKIVLIISMSLVGIALCANPVTPEKALQVASKVFASGPSTKAVDASLLQIVWDGEFEPATKAAQDPAFYVVSRPGGGFVIVSGNDNMQPVLAFSFENEFKVEGMPTNVRWWMEELKGYARSAVSPTPEILEAWDAFAETKAVIPSDQIDPLTEFTGSRTNLWSQDGPANLLTPTVPESGQGKSVCGCVPLALAEIMAWFGTSNKSELDENKYILSYDYLAYDHSTSGFTKEYIVPQHLLTRTHQWANLKALSSHSDFMAAPTAQASDLGTDVGNLVYDIGTILQVEYNESLGAAGGTSGNLGQLERLTSYMYYNKAALPKRRENYTSSEWITMLVAEIAKHPVYYTGQDTNNGGGHAFVADGYATTTTGKRVIHFNFGWGGTCNGYYDCLTDVQTTNHNLNFFKDNSALFGFVPDTGGATTSIIKLGLIYNGTVGGVSLAAGSSVTDDIVNLTVDCLENIGSAQFVGYIYSGTVNYGGARTGIQGAYLPVNVSDNYLVGMLYDFGSWGVPRMASPVLGDKYAFFYKPDGDENYYLIEGGSSGQVIAELPYYPAAFIKKNAEYHPNDDFVFELTNHDYRYGNASWTITNPDGVTNTYPQSDHKVKLTQTGWYTISVSTPGQETITAYINVQ